MATNTVSPQIDGQQGASSIQDVIRLWNPENRELRLDFSGVQRIGPEVLRLLEALAAKAANPPVKVVLSGVNVDIYRVLKLAGLASRFGFEPTRV